jgi:hypothetical protein
MSETLFTQGIAGQSDTLIYPVMEKLRYPHER